MWTPDLILHITQIFVTLIEGELFGKRKGTRSWGTKEGIGGEYKQSITNMYEKVINYFVCQKN